jgi:hypothetical protein
MATALMAVTAQLVVREAWAAPRHDFDTAHRPPQCRTADPDRRLRALPGLNAELNVLCSDLVAVVEHDSWPNSQGHDIPRWVRLSRGNNASAAQLAMVVGGNEWIIDVPNVR